MITTIALKCPESLARFILDTLCFATENGTHVTVDSDGPLTRIVTGDAESWSEYLVGRLDDLEMLDGEGNTYTAPGCSFAHAYSVETHGDYAVATRSGGMDI